MADDLYASAPNPSSSQHPPPTTTTTTSTHFPLESDDISNLLHTLLHNSSSSSSAQLPPSSSRLSVLIPQQQQHPPPPISLENRRQCLGSGLFIQSPSGIESSPGINFSYLGEYIAEGAIASPVERIGDLDFDSEKDNEASELPVNPAPPTGRGSSKRCRDAEVHNLSEKRRRQRINEKMKALQKLVPNSNKTDKASMLDEAIEYLKQLQLQVQMLTMRNGSTLHPFYLPGVVPTSQQPQMGAHFDEGNRMPSSRGTGSVPANREFHMQAIFDLSNQPGSSGQKKFLSRVTENNNLEHTFGLEPSTSAYYRPFNLSMLSKVKYCQLGTFSILRRNFAKIHHPVSLLRMKDGCVLKEMGTVETTRSNCKDNGKTAQVVQMSYG